MRGHGDRFESPGALAKPENNEKTVSMSTAVRFEESFEALRGGGVEVFLWDEFFRGRISCLGIWGISPRLGKMSVLKGRARQRLMMRQW
ncbi:hypothetical protein AKJ16_DCAP13993 [Drosera capensis]